MGYWGDKIAPLLGAFQHITFVDVLDILLCYILTYQLYKWTKRTAANGVIKGIIFLIIIRFFTGFIQLNALNWLIDSFFSTGSLIIIIVVVFQPEIRKVLEGLGTTGKRMQGLISGRNGEKVIDDVTKSILSMSRRRVGALIVFEQKGSLEDIVLTGTAIDGVISGPLLENIFEPNTPLHDGAVIVRGDRIVAAATYLPLSDDRTISRSLGTRHRAGIGISARTDCVSIIVSEETGGISVATNGELQRYYDEHSLRKCLTSLLMEDTDKAPTLLEWFRRKFVK